MDKPLSCEHHANLHYSLTCISRTEQGNNPIPCASYKSGKGFCPVLWWPILANCDLKKFLYVLVMLFKCVNQAHNPTCNYFYHWFIRYKFSNNSSLNQNIYLSESKKFKAWTGKKLTMASCHHPFNIVTYRPQAIWQPSNLQSMQHEHPSSMQSILKQYYQICSWVCPLCTFFPTNFLTLT